MWPSSGASTQGHRHRLRHRQQQLPGGAPGGKQGPHPWRGGAHRPAGHRRHPQRAGGVGRHPGLGVQRSLRAALSPPGPGGGGGEPGPAPSSSPWWRRGAAAPGTWSSRPWRRSTWAPCGERSTPWCWAAPTTPCCGRSSAGSWGRRWSWWTPGRRPPGGPGPAGGAGRPLRRGGPGQARYYTSDQTEQFLRLAPLFLGEDVTGRAEQIDITRY